MMISCGILVAITIEAFVGHLVGDEINLNWILLASIIVTGILCSVPTVLLLCEPDIPKNRYIIRIIIHFLCNYAIVCGLGYLFKWYTVLSGFLLLSGVFVLIYIFVWCGSLWTMRGEDRKINDALTEIRDEEE